MTIISLRVRTNDGNHVIQVPVGNTVLDLKKELAAVSHIPAAEIDILVGFPPTLLVANDSVLVSDVNIKSGDTLIVKKVVRAAREERPEPYHHTLSEGVMGGPLMRKVVPADNSCLFTSIGFLLGGKIDTTIGSCMRQIIVEQVSSDPETYSDGILGKPNGEYCKWIEKSESWGGAIEISILANYYGIELVVIDTINAVINRFGEDKDFDVRGFLIFDGIHYDPVYRETAEGEDTIQTLFPSVDISFLKQAEELAKEAQSSKQFTDVNRFTLRCLVCRKELTGQTAAQLHAKETGHLNFGEISS